MAAHDVEAGAVGAPGGEGEEPGDRPALVALGEEGLHHDALAVGGVGEAAQRHREAALGLAVEPVPGQAGEVLQLAGGDRGVPTDPGGVAELGELDDGAAHLGQVVDGERGGGQDRLIAQAQCAQPGLGVGARAGLGGADDGGHPAEGLGVPFEGQGGGGPAGGIAEGIAGGERDAQADPVDDPAVLAEERGLVPPGGEVSEGVGGVGREELAHTHLLVDGEAGLAALGAQQDGEGGEEAEGEPEADERENPLGHGRGLGWIGDELEEEALGLPPADTRVEEGAEDPEL